jgi:hypothetical protein
VNLGEQSWLVLSVACLLASCHLGESAESSTTSEVPSSTSEESAAAPRGDSSLIFMESPDSLPEGNLGLLGFVEDHGDSSYVRVAFKWTDGEWEPTCRGNRRWWPDGECERERSADTTWWALVRGGGVVGAVRSRGEALGSRLSDRGLALVGETAGLPWNDERMLDFAGWIHEPVHRPMLATTFRDPADAGSSIASTDISDELRDSLWPHFKTAVGKPIECTPYTEGEDQEVFEWEFDIDDMDVVGIVQTRAGTRVVGLRTRPTHNECDGPQGLSRSTFWFRIGSDGNVNLLTPSAHGDFVYELTPLEVADVNDDGDSEYIFWFSGYNHDGYVLFNRDFTHQAEFLWNYH